MSYVTIQLLNARHTSFITASVPAQLLKRVQRAAIPHTRTGDACACVRGRGACARARALDFVRV